MSKRPLRVLCLDIEGGFGGSSRSLYESLRHMDRGAIEPEVWCRCDGPARERYAELGIACRIDSEMPTMNSLPRLSRNLYGYARLAQKFVRTAEQRATLLKAVRDRFDLVHFNHEGLFYLARWLRKRHGKPQVMHVRTMIPNNVFGCWQVRQMAKANDRLVFITENEQDNVERLAGRKDCGPIIYNIAEPVAETVPPNAQIPQDGRLKVAVLSNYAYVRGVDRIVDIAKALVRHNRRDFLFVVAGNMILSGTLPGELGRLSRVGGTLADYAATSGVADMFLFLGHVAMPEAVLAGCDLLLKPTREDNPWGRDILEAMAAGKPVVSVGRYARFVETGVTGVLLNPFSADDAADALLKLDADRPAARRLGDNAMRRVAQLCNGSARASELLAVWRDAAMTHAAGATS